MKRGRKKKSEMRNDEGVVEYACRQGMAVELCEEYIGWCRHSGERITRGGKERRGEPRFPNIAGFCRYFGIGSGEYACLAAKYPAEFEKLEAIFEDEALNAEISPTVISAYLKRRLSYEKQPLSEVCDGQLRVIFDHDIMEDGI